LKAVAEENTDKTSKYMNKSALMQTKNIPTKIKRQVEGYDKSHKASKSRFVK
jgi:hypothetical protein